MRSDDRSCARTGSSPCAISARMSVGDTPSTLTRCRSTNAHSRSGAGIVGRAVVEDERAAVGERADDLPRPHDPADVGEPEQALAARAGPSGTRPPRRSSRGTRRARAPRPSAGRSCRSCTRRTSGCSLSTATRRRTVGAGRASRSASVTSRPGCHRHVGATEPRHDDDGVHRRHLLRPRRRRSPSSAPTCRGG